MVHGVAHVEIGCSRTGGNVQMGLGGLERSTVTLTSPLHRSQRYLASAYDSVASLIEETYPALRARRDGSRGRLTHAEQDIFRAAVVFTGAGIDTVFKESLRNCISIRVERSEGAREKYLDFVTRCLQEGSGINTRRLAALLTMDDPRQAMRGEYIEFLTGSSLQSRTQVTNSLSALGLEAEKGLYKEARDLDSLFRVRNEIAHELDMKSESVGGRGVRSRQERSITVYKNLCNTGLNYAQRMLNALDASLSSA